MYVYFVRHASAGQHRADPAKDEKRPLDSDGIAQCNLMGRALATLDTHIDLILSSPLKRASQTASLIANELAYEDRIVLTPALRPEANYARFTALLDEHARQEAIMVVGHNPNLSEFLGRVVGGGSRAGMDLKKGAVARVEVDRRRGILHWLLTPKIVRTFQESARSKSRPNTDRK
jgi:phosphohistidine phosphatase